MPLEDPFEWRDSLGKAIGADDTDEFIVKFHILPGGNSASVEIIPMNSRAASVAGVLDLDILATKLT